MNDDGTNDDLKDEVEQITAYLASVFETTSLLLPSESESETARFRQALGNGHPEDSQGRNHEDEMPVAQVRLSLRALASQLVIAGYKPRGRRPRSEAFDTARRFFDISAGDFTEIQAKVADHLQAWRNE